MASRTNHWKLGLFVVAGVAIAVAIVVWLGARERHDILTIQCFFDEPVEGLKIGSTVSHRGVPVGVVSKIAMAAEDPARHWVRVDIDIYWDVVMVIANLPEEMRENKNLRAVDEMGVARNQRVWRAQLQSSMLTGVSYIQTDLYEAKTPAPAYPFATPPETLHTVPSNIRKIEKEVGEVLDAAKALAEKLKGTLGNVDTMLETVNTAVSDLRVPELSKRLDRVLSDADQAILDLDTKKLSGHAADALAEARALLEDLRRKDGPIQRLADIYAKLGEDADKALADADLPGAVRAARTTLEQHVDPAADEAARLAGDLRNELLYLRRTLESITRLANRLDRDPSSLLRGRAPPEPIEKSE